MRGKEGARAQIAARHHFSNIDYSSFYIIFFFFADYRVVRSPLLFHIRRGQHSFFRGA